MKQIIMSLVFLLTTLTVFGQPVPTIKYSYGSGGFRIKREFITSSWKQGSDGVSKDTFVVLTRENLQEKIFAKAYPNPVNDFLFVENYSWIDGSTALIRVFDISNKQILEKKTSLRKESVYMGNIAPGTYSVNYYVNNAHIISWKIVKL